MAIHRRMLDQLGATLCPDPSAHWSNRLLVQTSTGDIPDETMRKIRRQLFGPDDFPDAGALVP